MLVDRARPSRKHYTCFLLREKEKHLTNGRAIILLVQSAETRDTVKTLIYYFLYGGKSFPTFNSPLQQEYLSMRKATSSSGDSRNKYEYVFGLEMPFAALKTHTEHESMFKQEYLIKINVSYSKIGCVIAIIQCSYETYTPNKVRSVCTHCGYFG